MRKRVLILMSLLLSLGLLSACGSSDDNSTAYDESDISMLMKTRANNANQGLLPVEELPEWIQEKLSYYVKDIDFYKESPNLAPKVYQCKWKDEIYYFIPNVLESCYYCNTVFHSDGMMVEWNSVDETIDFVSNSSSWKCIFFL
jgi:hypothetical protein